MTFIDPRGKLMSHLPRLALLQEGGVPAPVSIEADLSNRCQLGCTFCHFSHVHTKGPLSKGPKLAARVPGGDLMDVGLATRMVGEFSDVGVASISWTGGGEPTLHPNFVEIIEATAGTKLAQGIYTNAANLKDETIAVLKKHMTFVYVSLDAVDAASYKQQKQVDRFDAVCENIRRLVAAEGDATIGIGFLVTRDNWRDIPKAGWLGAQLDADYVQLRPTILYDLDDPGKPGEDTGWMTDAITLAGKAKYYQPNIDVDIGRFRRYQDWRGHGYPTCWWSALQSVVTPSGKMFTCVNLREHPAAEIGDLSVESFADIWARRPLKRVDGSCRVSCRGDVANVTLTEIMAPREHAAFV